MRDEALTCRENSFLEVSIKFHLSRAERRVGWARMGIGQSGWTGGAELEERTEDRQLWQGAPTRWACLGLQAYGRDWGRGMTNI